MATTNNNGDKNHTHNYFAIASMMNPVSLKGRGIHPLQSQPAILLDYKLRFFGTMGYAEAVPCTSTGQHKDYQFHGVIHTVTDDDMKILNDIEGHLYTPTLATAKLYDGTTLSVTVYCGSKENQAKEDHIPQERYLDIMVEGCQHFGVKQEYMDQLNALEKEPRPVPDQFLSFGPIPSNDNNAPTVFTMEQVLQQDGQEGRPIYAVCNHKVLEINNPTEERTGLFRMFRRTQNTPVVEDFVPKIVYDPLYGIPASRKECSPTHSAYLEHLTVQRLAPEGCKVVGVFVEED